MLFIAIRRVLARSGAPYFRRSRRYYFYIYFCRQHDQTMAQLAAMPREVLFTGPRARLLRPSGARRRADEDDVGLFAAAGERGAFLLEPSRLFHIGTFMIVQRIASRCPSRFIEAHSRFLHAVIMPRDIS